jgi:hypothetical protein
MLSKEGDFMIRQFGRGMLIAFSISLLLVGGLQSMSRASFPDDMKGSKEAALNSAMRKLWEDHITWTRVFIISAVAGLPDKDAATQRLLQNQVDIGNAIKPFYGNAAGDQLTALLKDHIVIAADVVTAAKANDKPKLDDANKRWSDNADQIAAFLSKANPKNWPENEMRTMLHDHLKLTTNEAVARIQGDWAADVKAYDAVHEEILHMADGLSMGIVKQFPDKFK